VIEAASRTVGEREPQLLATLLGPPDLGALGDAHHTIYARAQPLRSGRAHTALIDLHARLFWQQAEDAREVDESGDAGGANIAGGIEDAPRTVVGEAPVDPDDWAARDELNIGAGFVQQRRRFERALAAANHGDALAAPGRKVGVLLDVCDQLARQVASIVEDAREVGHASCDDDLTGFDLAPSSSVTW
jgi:hypothetical protein